MNRLRDIMREHIKPNIKRNILNDIKAGNGTSSWPALTPPHGRHTKYPQSKYEQDMPNLTWRRLYRCCITAK